MHGTWLDSEAGGTTQHSAGFDVGHHGRAQPLDLGRLQLRRFPRRALRREPLHGRRSVRAVPLQGRPGHVQGSRLSRCGLGLRPSAGARDAAVDSAQNHARRCGGTAHASDQVVATNRRVAVPARGFGLTAQAFFARDAFAAIWASTPEGALDAIAVRGMVMAGLPGVMTWVLLGALMWIFSGVPAKARVLVIVVAAWELLVWAPTRPRRACSTASRFREWSPLMRSTPRSACRGSSSCAGRRRHDAAAALRRALLAGDDRPALSPHAELTHDTVVSSCNAPVLGFSGVGPLAHRYAIAASRRRRHARGSPSSGHEQDPAAVLRSRARMPHVVVAREQPKVFDEPAHRSRVDGPRVQIRRRSPSAPSRSAPVRSRYAQRNTRCRTYWSGRAARHAPELEVPRRRIVGDELEIRIRLRGNLLRPRERRAPIVGANLVRRGRG